MGDGSGERFYTEDGGLICRSLALVCKKDEAAAFSVDWERAVAWMASLMNHAMNE